MQTRLAQRVFTFADQERFAAVSGDCNPMHMDALQARRTQAGAPVVHGIHLLLWMLDSLGAAQPDIACVRSIRAQFNKFVYLDETVEVVLTQQDARRARALIPRETPQTLDVVHGAGHLVHEERPADVAQLILRACIDQGMPA